ncbi:MAG: zinc ABC transporter substrate-binding protein [Bacteroidales bacterium]
MKIAVLTFVALLLTGCISREQTDSKPELAVTILPQEYFVSKIAGDLFNINVLVPPGASPATYEPTPAQLASLSRTDLYLMMGHTGFEMAWMEKLAAANKKMTLKNLSEGVDLIMEDAMHEAGGHQHGHHHGGVDPHTWLSPVSVKIIAENIYEALAESYPEHKDQFLSNLENFMIEIDSLNLYITNEFSGLASRGFFTYHPSLSYFARDYGLEQHPLELGGKTPSSAHMKHLIDLGIEERIGVIFLQLQFDQKNAAVLAKEIGAEIVQINPLDPDWYNQMIYITDKIKQNLQ